MFARLRKIVPLAAATLAASLAVVGCTGKAAAVRQEKARALAASASKPAVAGLAKAAQRVVAKPTPRDSAFAKYSDIEYGASFRYPRNFALIESSDSDADGDGDADSDRVISWQQAKQAGTGIRTAEELS